MLNSVRFGMNSFIPLSGYAEDDREKEISDAIREPRNRDLLVSLPDRTDILYHPEEAGLAEDMVDLTDGDDWRDPERDGVHNSQMWVRREKDESVSAFVNRALIAVKGYFAQKNLLPDNAGKFLVQTGNDNGLCVEARTPEEFVRDGEGNLHPPSGEEIVGTVK